MIKEENLKKQHHYVWAYYLLNWSQDKQNVWYRTAKKKLICESTKMAAKERNFYKIKPLYKEHIYIIKLLSSKSSLEDDHMQLLKKFIIMQNYEAELKKNSIKNIELYKKYKHFVEVHKHNSLENLHAKYERNAKKIIEDLSIKKDLSCLLDKNNIMAFCLYIGQQFTRTKAFKDNSLFAMSKNKTELGEFVKNILSECWWFVSHMLGTNIGLSLYEGRNKDNHCLLINETSQKFITSDLPVINVHKELETGVPPKHHQFDFYYPLSPNVAFMFCCSKRFPNGVSNLSLDDVIEMNTKIAKGAHVHIFGDSKDVLKLYTNDVENRYTEVK